MSAPEVSATLDAELFAEVVLWNRYYHGINAKRSEYVKRAIRSQVKRDRASWEKTHPVGSSPFDTGKKLPE